MRIRAKRFLGIILSLALTLGMALGPIPGITTTALADAPTIKVGDYIRMGAYNGYDVDWFCAKINGTGTMMLSKYVITNSRFGANATYKTSDIHNYLDGGTFATDLGLTLNELSLVRTVNLSGSNGDGTDRFIIPAYGNNELNKGTGGTYITQTGYIDNPSSIASIYWLRTPRDGSNARVVRSIDNTVVARYSGAVYGGRGLRPMFYLDTEKFKTLPHTGSGTEADPYVFEDRYSINSNIPTGCTVSASAKQEGQVIYKGTFKGSQHNKLVKGIEVNLSPQLQSGYVLGELTASKKQSDDVDAPFTPLSGTNGNNNENYTTLVDGNTSTKWCLNFNASNPPYVIIKAANLMTMTGYSLTTANDNASYNGRNWKSWVIYGANFASDSEATKDSVKWNEVVSVSNDTTLSDVNFTKFDYQVTSATPYQYYKIEVTGSKGAGVIQMSEFSLRGTSYEKINLTESGDGYTYTMPEANMQINSTLLGTVHFVKKDIAGNWSTVESDRFSGNTYTLSKAIVDKYSTDKYVLKGYSTAYSEDGKYNDAAEGQTINLGTGSRNVYLYYELAGYDLNLYQDIGGTEIYKTVTVPYGTSLASFAEEKPAVQAHDTFAGWSTEKNQSTFNERMLVDWTNKTMADSAMNFYPIWVHDKVKVQLKAGYDGASSIEPSEVDLGSKITTASQEITRDGYTLDGWYTEKGTKWDDTWNITPEYCDKDAEGNDIVKTDDTQKYNYYTLTLTAHWSPKTVDVVYKLGEHSKSGATAPANGSVAMGSTTTLASATGLAADAYLFTGWKDSKGNIHSDGGSFTFNDFSVVGNDGKITLTAQYVEKAKVKLFFDTQGGTAINPITEYVDATISLGSYTTTRTGYTFDKWSIGDTNYSADASYTIPSSGSEIVTLTAHWKVNKYTLTFDSMGGTAIASITQNYDTAVTAPTGPTREHYDFMGWYPELPAKMPAENLTLTAIWKPTTYTVKFMNGETEVSTVTDIYGAAVNAPADPTKEGHAFGGWKDSSEQMVTFPVYVTGNATYNAVWKPAVSYQVTFKVVNGKWDDDTDADKIVTFNGYEGDTWKLLASQIPKVGTKPASTFKEGSWDVTPNTATAISEAKTYTYTYAQKDSISATVTFKVSGGAWNDDTTADKIVTLTGYEGDTLELTAAQIPEAGAKPDDSHTEGAWAETPVPNTVVTENITYYYVYEAKSQTEINEAIEIINTLKPADQVTAADKTAIEAARAAYDELTPEQKQGIPADTLKKLTDAEEVLPLAIVNESIDAIDVDKVTSSDKTDIEAARAAFNALTPEQKEKISSDKLDKLMAAEAALEAATVSDTIDELPLANEVTTANKDAIEAARAAYDTLSDAQKEKISADILSKLEVCELALAIAELPEATTVTSSDKTDIEAARAAFNALTPAQKANIPDTVLSKLKACELVITIAELPEANAVTTSQKTDIEAARSTYNALDDIQKNKISADVLLKLELADTALAIAELPDADKVTGSDKAAIEAASAKYNKLTEPQKTQAGDAAKTKLEAVEAALKIAELPEENAVTTTNKEAIEAARDAYDKLSDAQKNQVGETLQSKLEANEVALAKKLIEVIPDSGEINTGNADKVAAAKAAYDKLSEAQKEKITEAEKAKLDEAEAVFLIVMLPATDAVTTSDKEAIEAARIAYNTLTDEQKSKISADTLNKLIAAEVKLAQIAMSEVSGKGNQDDDVIYNGNPIQLINIPTTTLSAGYTMVYAVTTENEAPADSLYTADIPVGTGAGTYHVWYKVVDAENHDVTEPSHVTVTIEKGNSSQSDSPTNTSSEESGLIYSGHPQELVTAGTA
ncbi:MAG: InlB B-repeat-containing protein [Pseudobutyrivibrio sp.]|nr:InlB B-repeat-containing protein [Pseudobutyrivibrio sp.]